MGRIATFILGRRWLAPGNVYAAAPAEYIEANLIRGPGMKAAVPDPPPASDQLAEYIVASGPWHAMDGWAYLGRALDAHTHGDRPSAVHFAYYAELRAAMSLLASEGIGILNRRHFVLDASGHPISFGSPSSAGPGTHDLTWLALEEWATLTRAVDLLSRVVTPFGEPIQNWFSGGLASITQWAPSATRWLQRLGLDLAALPLDHNARNRASYRVTGLTPLPSYSPDKSLDFLIGAWRLVEPTPASPFEQLDRQLLRTTLRESYAASFGEAGAGITLRDYIQSAVDTAIGVGVSRTATVEYLEHEPQTEASLTALAKMDPSDPNAPPDLPIVARATLLLRIASGSWRRMFNDVGISAEALAFSWAPYARQRGILDPNVRLSDCIELWEDVASALEDVEAWRRATEPTQRTAYAMYRQCDVSFGVLTRCERIGLWGMA